MKSKSNWVLMALSVVGLVVFGMQQLRAADGVEAKQAYAMVQQGALLLDVREPDEYSAGHAPDAKLIPLGQLGIRLQELSAYKDKPVVVMCRSGRRSAQAVEFLRSSGFSQVSNLKGGINAWQGDGLAVVRM